MVEKLGFVCSSRCEESSGKKRTKVETGERQVVHWATLHGTTCTPERKIIGLKNVPSRVENMWVPRRVCIHIHMYICKSTIHVYIYINRSARWIPLPKFLGGVFYAAKSLRENIHSEYFKMNSSLASSTTSTRGVLVSQSFWGTAVWFQVVVSGGLKSTMGLINFLVV